MSTKKRTTRVADKGMATKKQRTGTTTTTTTRVVAAPAKTRGITALPAAWQPSQNEIKAIDIPGASYNFRGPATATGITLLNGIQTGTGFYNRIGSRIEMKSLQIHGNVEPSTQNSDEQLLRFLIVYDRQPTGALPVITDVLQDRSQTGAANTVGTSGVNLDNRDRFIIIRDMHYQAPTCTITAGTPSFETGYSGQSRDTSVNEFIKLKGLGTHFKSTSSPTTIADIASGALYAIYVCSGNDSAWDFTGSYRLRYDDL